MRKTDAQQHRETAAQIAHDRQHPVHVANGEERAYRDAKSFMSFTKGLPHDQDHGLVKDELDPVRLRTAIDSGYTRDFDLNVPLGDRNPPNTGPLQWQFHNANDLANGRIDLHHLPDGTDRPQGEQHRRWEAPTAGWVYDLQGPDAQAVTMPPAPPIVVQGQTKSDDPYAPPPSDHGIKANPELVAEMAEVYWLAWLRDRHLSAFDEKTDINADNSEAISDANAVQMAIEHLETLKFYQIAQGEHPRRRLTDQDQDGLTRQNVFRGHTPGERKGPYLSQFMLMGTKHLGDNSGRSTQDGLLQYGSITIDMRVRNATRKQDYMTHWNEWLDVQNGANVGEVQGYVDHNSADPLPHRFITTPRDLATYVHFDALYEAYLNACIWLLNTGAPFDPNFRHLLSNTRHTTGFALYGGPHILSLMTEVATRGLKAVRFQKFNSHLRLRPEALAGLIAAKDHGVTTLPAEADKSVGLLINELGSGLLDRIKDHNATQNSRHSTYLPTRDDTTTVIADKWNLPLLPMAFPEGSPMHPTYGAGHATVAGACVTILKAFFDEDACLVLRGDNVKAVSADEIDRANDDQVAYVPDSKGETLLNHGSAFKDYLRVGDELNKLAANISIARNMAGVHYYSDYIDSLRMGEEIALGVLQEQSIMYPKDPFHVSLTSFDGRRVIIGDGEIQCLEAENQHPPHPHNAAAADLIAALKESPELRSKLLAELDEGVPDTKVA